MFGVYSWGWLVNWLVLQPCWLPGHALMPVLLEYFRNTSLGVPVLLHHGYLSPENAFFEGGDHVLLVSVAHNSSREEFPHSKQPFFSFTFLPPSAMCKSRWGRDQASDVWERSLTCTLIRCFVIPFTPWILLK